MTDEQLNQYESEAHKQVVEDDWVVVEWVYDLIKEVRGYKTEVERLNYIIAVMEADSNNVYAGCGKFHRENKEMQKTIETAFNIACEEFETVNQLELVRATLGDTLQSLKGDKP